VLMIDPDDVLLNDRAVVETLGDVMGGRPDEFHAALLGPFVGIGAEEGRQERVVDVDQWAAHLGQEAARYDLHLPGEHHQVDVSAE